MSDDDAEMDNFSEDGGESQEEEYGGVDMTGYQSNHRGAPPKNEDELVVTDDDSDKSESHREGGQGGDAGVGYSMGYEPQWDNDGNEISAHYNFGHDGNANNNGIDYDAESDGEDDDDDDAQEMDDFDIEEEDDEDAALNAEIEKVMEEMQTYEQWKELDNRTKLYSIIEPGISAECDIPPANLKVTTVYAMVYFCAVVLQVGTLLLLSFDRFIENPSIISAFNAILLISIIIFAVDFILRCVLCTRPAKVPMIVLDFFTLLAAIVIFLELDAYIEIAQFIVPLRASRMFLVTRLFLHTDTFRDINMAFITIANSAKSLSIFVCLLVVGLFVFSTAVYLLERGEFDPVRRAWYRKCVDLAPCDTEYSPFQSIPDALWLIINTMTIVGLGDVYPATTPGRMVTGLAMIAGVFVIAFPTMVLVGNLTLVRKNYFREEEKDRIMREDAELFFLEKRRAEQEAESTMMANSAFGGASSGFRGASSAMMELPVTGKSNNIDFDVDSNNGSVNGGAVSTAGSSVIALGGNGMQSLQSMSQVGVPSGPGALNAAVANLMTDIKPRSYFAYMGDPSREVRMTKNPQVFHYQPLLQVLCDEDGKPTLSCIHQVSDKILTCQMSLILDDITAQRAAEKAVRGGDSYGENAIFCRATPIYGMEINMTSHVRGVRLNRRSDVGVVHDLCVPLTLTVAYDGEDDILDRLEVVKADMQNVQLVIQCSTQPLSSGLWMETCFLTSDMLAPTPFVVDLKAIAQHLSTDFLSGAQAERAANPEAHIFKHRDLAFCAHNSLTSMMKPVLALFLGEGEIIRNASQVLDNLVRIIALHCRQVRLSDLPPSTHPAVYGVSKLKPYERLYEIDVDFFRIADWPLGSVRVEKAQKCKSFNVSSIIGSGRGLDQPELFNPEAFVNPFKSNISLETTMARDHAEGEIRAAYEEQARQLGDVAAKAQEAIDRREAKRREEGEFDAVVPPGDAEDAVNAIMADSDSWSDLNGGDSDRDSVDAEGLTSEERNQVQQALLFGK